MNHCYDQNGQFGFDFDALKKEMLKDHVETCGEYVEARNALQEADYFNKNNNLYLEVQLTRKSYGRELFKPISKDAIFLAELMKCINFTKEELKRCKSFGWKVNVTHEEYNL